MTEQQIRDGYERLDGALAPPLDAQARVASRVSVRRRRRRAGIAGAGALVLAASVGTAVALNGGDDPSGDRVAVDPPSGPQSTLVMTRQDGSTYAFDNVTVTCDPPPGELVEPGPQRIWAVSPRDYVDDRMVEPYLYVMSIVDEVDGGESFSFPVDWTMDWEDEPLIVFVADSEGAKRGNEVSSDEVGSAGTVRILEASCEPTPVLRIQVDMTLGSEVSQGTIDLAGALR